VSLGLDAKTGDGIHPRPRQGGAPMKHPWAVPPGYRTAPPRFNIAEDVLDRPIAQGRGPDAAMRDDRGSLAFRELADAVARCAGGLRSLGVERGTPFLIRSPNCREAYVAFLAGVRLAAVPILANSLLAARELAHVVDNGDPVLAVAHADAAAAVWDLQRDRRPFRHVVLIGGAEAGAVHFDALLGAAPAATVDVGRDDPAFIAYTSGTTGVPKGIVHAHRWVAANGDLARLHMALVPGDVVMNTSEFSFGWGLGHGFLWPLRNGGSVAILGPRPTAERLLAGIERFGVTVLATVPTLIRAILAMPDAERRYRLDSLRHAFVAGEPLAEPTYREWKRRFGCELYDAYGASEFQVIVANGPGLPVRPGSMGRPHPAVALRVLDEALEECAPGEVGAIALRADDPGLFLEYRKQPDRWRDAHRGGWYMTGDQAYRDDDGYLWYVGRQDDLFKSRGYLISPKEIEDAILEHPAVMEAAVVGQPDAEIGHRVAAFVVLQPGGAPPPALEDEIRQKVRSMLAPYKAPHVVTVVESLPKSPVGKILRRALR
jgi:acyl-coenzyme A synthetase/AMP-(fatty) acid ligase